MAKNDENLSWKKFRRLNFTKKSLNKRLRKIETKTVKHAKRFVSSRLERLSAVKRNVFGWVSLVLILVIITSLQWISFRDSYTVTAYDRGGTYSEGVIGPLETLNPIYARSSAEKSASKLLFASLYNYDSTGTIKADLAESVSANETETRYTVKLRQGVKWSDGAPLTAQDVVFTVNLLRDPKTNSSITGWESFKAEAPDARTVVFTLPGAYASFLHTLTFPILPNHALAGIKSAELREQPFSQSPVTSGPFALRMMQNTSADGSRKIAHLVSNPRYIHGEPRLERFQLNVYSTREEIESALKTNEIMATSELFYDKLPRSTQKMYQHQSYSINDGVFAMYNNRDGLLANANIRRALSVAVDVDKLRDSLDRPTSPLDGPILQSQVSATLPSADQYDLNQAKSLLEKEGWKLQDGKMTKDGQQLTLKLVALKSANFSQTTEKLTEIWRRDLGIKLDVEVVDPLDPSRSVLQTILQPRNYDVLVYELVLGGDPDVYAYWHSSQASSSGLNFANYSNSTADEALSSGRAKADDKFRSDRYVTFTKKWIADAPALPIFQPKIDYIYSKNSKVTEENSVFVYPENRFNNVIYWSVNNTSVYKTP